MCKAARPDEARRRRAPIGPEPCFRHHELRQVLECGRIAMAEQNGRSIWHPGDVGRRTPRRSCPAISAPAGRGSRAPPRGRLTWFRWRPRVRRYPRRCESSVVSLSPWPIASMRHPARTGDGETAKACPEKTQTGWGIVAPARSVLFVRGKEPDQSAAFAAISRSGKVTGSASAFSTTESLIKK
ncbi:MAG: hypothetical protein QOF73_3313 [Thermomicrobiales bacterium]|nr:hypothetical protein [Thermomicrobiales bacterium]